MAEEEEFSKLPLQEQFTHKNWKARKGGYEIAAKEFKIAPPNAPIVRDFIFDSNLWKGAVGDSNVAAQQEALVAYNAFLDAAGTEGARKTRGLTVGPIVEKGLIGRPAAKASSVEALLLLIELDRADPIIEELLPFLSHKLPKIIAATLAALKEIYHAYGCKTVEPKPVIKLLPKVFGHADKNVRAEAQSLTVELFRWLRDAMKPLFWGELKEVQQKDLEKLFEPVKAEPAPKQERLLRSQQAAKEEAEATAGAAGEEGDDGDEGGDIDLEPEYEAVDVFPKIPNDFNDRLASAKWKDRKEALEEVFNAVNVPAIKEGPFDDIMRACAKSMKDANIMVVQIAANVIECIAKGLRKGFGRYRSTVLAAMLERFKEKKQAVTDAIGAACDAVFASTGLGDVQADVLEALKSKNPQVKESTAKFLIRSLKSTREAPSPEQTKEVSEAAKKLLAESTATLRDAGAEILGVLWKIMGDRNMLAHLEGLDDIRKTKIKEFSDAAEVKAKWKPKAAAPPPKAASGPPGKKPALGAKRAPAGAVKKPAPARPQTPPQAEDPPALQARPTSRPAVKGPAGLRPPGGGLKAPGSGLQKPAPSLKAPSVVTSATASPKRQGMVIENPPIPMTPRAAPGRGLTGRPLGKPQQPASPTPAPSVDQGIASLRETDRQEILSLQQENAMLRDQLSALRSDKSKMSSQIAELQVQNAQLIEDHTRDVLQIKAKETQLVRARSDAENAVERANSLSKEIERLKREMSRLNRDVGRDSPVDGHRASFQRPVAGYNGGMSTMDGLEGKENMYQPSHALSGNKLTGAGGMHRPGSRTLSNGTTSPDPISPRLSSTTSFGGSTSGSGLARSSSDAGAGGVESWKRAAEVTQNLKARIEMMKARQNLGRGQ